MLLQVHMQAVSMARGGPVAVTAPRATVSLTRSCDEVSRAEIDDGAAVTLQRVVHGVGVEVHVGDGGVEGRDVVPDELIRHRLVGGVEGSCEHQRDPSITTELVVSYIAVGYQTPEADAGRSTADRDPVSLDHAVLHAVVEGLISKGKDAMRIGAVNADVVVADDDRRVLDLVPGAE